MTNSSGGIGTHSLASQIQRKECLMEKSKRNTYKYIKLSWAPNMFCYLSPNYLEKTCVINTSQRRQNPPKRDVAVKNAFDQKILEWKCLEMMFEFMRQQSLTVAVLLKVLLVVSSFSVERNRLPGIWKLKSDSLLYEPDIREKMQGRRISPTTPREILIKLNPDGSFKQCNEGYCEGRWLVGRWEITDEQILLLALRRQYYGPQFDVMLEGHINGTSSLKVVGHVQKGRFMYPQKHPAFFEATLINRETIGNFTLEQSVATSSVTSGRLEHLDAANRFQRADFYGRHFMMVIEPIETKTSSGNHELQDLPFDVRAMPIQFHSNNTFQAMGVNKILRGHFHITENNQLGFEVSLFGMGRSVSGSVYSEGVGLSHEDRRCYIGSIHDQGNKIHVEGTVMFGTDMGTDARPEPVGIFILTETVPNIDDIILNNNVTDEDFGIFE